MGVLNLTPDSFFDGGLYLERDAGVAQIHTLLEQGADIIDIGGESSRPGAPAVGADEQIARVGWAVEEAVRQGAIVSIDTTDPSVADVALQKGARIVNDVSCLADPRLAEVAAKHGATLLLCHSRGPMSAMPGFSEWPDADYGDVVEDVRRDLLAVRDRAVALGLSADRVWLDPGIGFSKNARQSVELLRRLGELKRSDLTIAVGPGRKSFIASVDGSAPEERLGGTISACVHAMTQGADVLRVHDIQAVRQALQVFRTIAHPPELGAARA